jgi:MFS transporter, DHA1 family, inner membrane transport protein
MSTTQISGSRGTLAMAALFLGAFVVGSAELVVVGVLSLISEDTGVPISTSGTLVTAYSLGISVGGPVLTAATMRFGRRFLLWLSFAAYVVGNLVAAAAVSFGMLLVARIATGLLHGLFMGVAFAVAGALVPPERMGRAISVVFGGFALSTALGLPAGNLIGQEFGWPAAFVAVVIVGVVSLVATLLFVPPVPNTGVGGAGAQARDALHPRVLAVLGVGFLLLGGQYAALTYITPFLQDVTGISGPLISVFLLAYGLANAIGTFLGGWAADRGAGTTLVIATALLVLALGVLYVAGSHPVVVALALTVFGLVGFGLVPSLQYRVVTLAGSGRDLAATLPQSAVTAGIATGALVGGWALAGGGPSAAVLTGLVSCAIALPAVWATGLLRVPEPAAPVSVAEPTAS